MVDKINDLPIINIIPPETEWTNPEMMEKEIDSTDRPNFEPE